MTSLVSKMVEAKGMSVHPRIFLDLFVSLLCRLPGYVMACNGGAALLESTLSFHHTDSRDHHDPRPSFLVASTFIYLLSRLPDPFK